ncbi:hypothetical protein H9M94_02240 [Mycoplasma sp. Pen4]|uniref:hypothetical protein n=1 Tax=Mycoplasma sp. Pen4 TaxID=640330 RepID=UPI001654AE08|nr:hypothetical protein [Mycoplasma sp. Pen4]QNM93412.1 hypothetical protein H9M94_02240 [Mycoplasma sp. Pen4]
MNNKNDKNIEILKYFRLITKKMEDITNLSNLKKERDQKDKEEKEREEKEKDFSHHYFQYNEIFIKNNLKISKNTIEKLQFITKGCKKDEHELVAALALKRNIKNDEQNEDISFWKNDITSPDLDLVYNNITASVFLVSHLKIMRKH